ncbi:hypothetical protein [Methylobacterium soli]|uniref:hypothetical protein n=1 Tax=Methylobacterium soli TaxID=553447 RepID=UPI001EE1CA2A|nr:hypothetical protein [Methylobacterium soli]GJE45315.1 hypothetical protein AEGHOMDF_4509 [Methylobacterium soli]
MALKYFGAWETAKGVSAAPWSARHVYARTFIKADWWPHRMTKGNGNGHVFERAGSTTNSRLDRSNKVKSGLFIPDEMVKSATASAFNGTAAAKLPDRLAHELLRVLG